MPYLLIYPQRGKTQNKGGWFFPDQASVLRLVGMNLKEIDDDWRAGRNYFHHESMQMLKDLKSVLEKEKTSFLVNVMTDLSLEAQSNLHH